MGTVWRRKNPLHAEGSENEKLGLYGKGLHHRSLCNFLLLGLSSCLVSKNKSNLVSNKSKEKREEDKEKMIKELKNRIEEDSKRLAELEGEM